jgi:hypothetical protein
MYSPTHLDLGTRWRWVVSFTPLPLYPRGKTAIHIVHCGFVFVLILFPCMCLRLLSSPSSGGFSQCITSARAVCGSHGNVLASLSEYCHFLVAWCSVSQVHIYIPHLNIPLSSLFSHIVDCFSLVRSKEKCFSYVLMNCVMRSFITCTPRQT